MKKFETFKGYIPPNFRELMINYWMEDENSTREEVLAAYDDDESFERLCNMEGERTFIPDLGYSDKEIDGTLCFESVDNNFCIPVKFIMSKPLLGIEEYFGLPEGSFAKFLGEQQVRDIADNT